MTAVANQLEVLGSPTDHTDSPSSQEGQVGGGGWLPVPLRHGQTGGDARSWWCRAVLAGAASGQVTIAVPTPDEELDVQDVLSRT